MNKKKEEKKEKTLKIIKIVGSAIGLTLCAGAFVSLLVLGVRGCAHQSNVQVNQTTERAQKRLSLRQLNNVVVGDEYLNTKVVSGVNNGKLYHAYNNSDDMNRQFPYSADVTCNGETYYIVSAYVHTEFEMDVTFELLDHDGQAVIYGTAYDNGEDSLEWDDFASEVWDFYPASTLLGNLTIKQNYEYENNPAVDMLNAFYEDYFTNVNNLINKNVTFNDVINPYGPFGGNFDYFFENSLSGRKIIFNGLFKDGNGSYYTQIRMYFVSATGQLYGSSSNYNKYTGTGFKYVEMCYVDLVGNEIFVNGQDYSISTAPGDNNDMILTLSNHWVSSYYKNIFVLVADNDGVNVALSMDPLTRLSTFNNTSSYIGITTGSTGYMGDIFGLIRGAFTSWLPILNIQVLPGIALGVFVFLPLIGMIILFVVWLFKR